MAEFDTAVGLRVGLKKCSRQLRLPDNASQRATAERIVKWNGNGYCRCLQSLLHDSVTPALERNDESIFENATDLAALLIGDKLDSAHGSIALQVAKWSGKWPNGYRTLLLR